ncbi:MAG: prephenate dehydrogenase [Bacillota bacterium]
MRVGIIGMGLIGGSFAKAVKLLGEHEVYGWDESEIIRQSARLAEAVDGFLEDGNPEGCDLVLMALYPQATIAYVEKFRKSFSKNAKVLDCAGVKVGICEKIGAIAKEEGFFFCGGHPMAGLERSGFTYATGRLFRGATMILTPDKESDLGTMNEISQFFKSIGFLKMQVATPEEHDKMIAYTSQLAHVVSSAYIKSELSTNFSGFSAGSFQDMTRVAKLNEDMWSELFLENKEFLVDEIDILISRLTEYRDAIKDEKVDELKKMLKDGKEKRLAIDHDKEFA